MELLISPDDVFSVIANRAKPSSTRNIVPLLYCLAKLIKARLTLEIGIGWGFGSFALGLHAKEVNGVHYAIDAGSVSVQRLNDIKNQYNLPINILHASSSDVLWDKRIDLLFIDGGHSYEQVKSDILKFTPFVRKHGIVCFHDYDNVNYGVKKAVLELFDDKKFQMFYLPYETGVVLWLKI